MPKHYRRLFYYVFLLGFLISAPIVVLYTAGYRYHPGLGKIVKTGIVSLASVPKNADIYIDDQKQEDRTPAVLDTIPAGSHLVRVEKEGYNTWEKTLNVESNLTTFATSILLFLDQEPQSIISQEVLLISPSHDQENAAFLTSGESWIEIWLLNNTNQSISLLTRLPFVSTENLELHWSPDNSQLLLSSLASPSESTIIPIKKQEATSFPSIDEPIEHLSWDVGSSHHLLLSTASTLYRFDASQGDLENLFSLSGTAQSTSNGFFVAETVSDRTVITSHVQDEVTILAYVPLGNYRFLPITSTDFLLLEEPQHGRLVLLDASGSDQPILLNTQASLWQWSEGQQLLYSNGFDLHVYDASMHTDTTLTRTSEEITGLTWHPDLAHILYAQKDIIYALELDYRDERNITPLAKGISFKTIWLDDQGDNLYFYGTVEDETGLFLKMLQR